MESNIHHSKISIGFSSTLGTRQLKLAAPDFKEIFYFLNFMQTKQVDCSSVHQKTLMENTCILLYLESCPEGECLATLYLYIVETRKQYT